MGKRLRQPIPKDIRDSHKNIHDSLKEVRDIPKENSENSEDIHDSPRKNG